MINISTSSSTSFVNEHKMDQVFRMYEHYLASNSTEDIDAEISDVELSFEENDIMEKLINKHNVSLSEDIHSRKISFPEQLALIKNIVSNLNGVEDFISKFHQQTPLSKSLETMNEQEIINSIRNLINDVNRKKQEYPEKLAAILKCKYDQLLNDLNKDLTFTEERFQKRRELIEKQLLKSSDSSYKSKFSELVERIRQKEITVNETLKSYDILLEIFKQDKL